MHTHFCFTSYGIGQSFIVLLQSLHNTANFNCQRQCNDTYRCYMWVITVNKILGWNEMGGVSGHDSALYGYRPTGSGTTWDNEMNGMNHVQGSGSNRVCWFKVFTKGYLHVKKWIIKTKQSIIAIFSLMFDGLKTTNTRGRIDRQY